MREDPADPDGCANKQRVLDACEAAICRLAYDRAYFARPARSLFGEVRNYFSFNDQLLVYKVIERGVSLALEYFEALPEPLTPDGAPRHCQAVTRRGTECRRERLPGLDYCPSHRHLQPVVPVSQPESELLEGSTELVERPIPAEAIG